MKKLLRFIVVSLFIMGLVTPAAMAGSTWVNHGAANNTPTVALETLGAARNVTIGPPATGNIGAVVYNLSQNLTSTNLLTVTFYDGLAFTGGNYIVCANVVDSANAANNIGTYAPSAGSTTANFQLTTAYVGSANLAAGNNIWIASSTSSAIGLNCNSAAANFMAVQLMSGAASAGTKNIGIKAMTSGSVIIDQEGLAGAANVAREFGGSVTTKNMIYDYLGTDSSDGTLFVRTGDNLNGANNVAANAVALNLTTTPRTYRTVVGAQNAGLTAGALIKFDATTDWTGVSKVWATAQPSGSENYCSYGSANANSNVVTSPSGAVNLTLTAAAFNGGIVTGANNLISICLQVDGTTPLTSRDIIGTYDIQVSGTGANDPGEASATWQTWRPNGWQAFMPHMRFNTTTRTFVRVVNGNARDAIIYGDIVLPDGTALDRIQVGTIPAGETVTYNATEIAALAGITTVDNYAMTFLGTVDGTKVYANAFFNLLSDNVWTTRNVTLYEGTKSAYTMK